ncbi:MAG: DUF1552 domain-containing protein, partial [Nannocystaceae bacterium]|nr:DUF1552 domain-containing protein [Nannocystaceae bacterium]
EGTSLAPMAHHASKLLVPRGIHTAPRGFGWDEVPGDDHAKGMAHRLTGSPIGAEFASSISVDQEIANALNESGAPALNLQVGRGGSGVTGFISYRGPEQPVVNETNPWLAYQDLMGLEGLDDLALQRLIARRQSVLDLVNEDFDRLRNNDLSSADRAKLDMHLTAIRDLEIDMGGAGLVPCVLPDARQAELQALDPETVENDGLYPTVGRMMMDVVALAIACGSTRAATLQWGSGAGGPIFTWGGMNHQYNHHKLSHGNTADDCSGGAVEGYEDMLFDIDTWQAGEFAYLLDRLESYVEGDGTVLDHSCVVWGNDLSNGLAHDFRDMPYVMAGSCCDYFRTGQYIKVTASENTVNDDDVPHNMLLTTILNAVGVPSETFGDPAFGDPGEIELIKA